MNGNNYLSPKNRNGLEKRNFFQHNKAHAKKGISMVTLIITIILLLILAGIAIVGSYSAVGDATHAKYSSALADVEDKVQAKRTQNKERGPGEEILNYGFTKVIVEGAPADFISFDDDAITGYWVSMDSIQEDSMTIGTEELTETKIKFNLQDVYVYDARGKVYYAKGWRDGDDVLYYRLDSKQSPEENEIKPEIISATYALSGDKKSAVITVVANPKNGGTLEVIIGGKVSTKTDENTYEITVTENGTKSIVVKESTGGSASTHIQIRDIEIEVDTTAPEITDLSSVSNDKTIKIQGNAKDDESNIVGYNFTTTSDEPTEWTSVNSPTVSVSYIATINGTYYLWVKNEVGLISNKEIIVTMPEVYTITYNANGGSLGSVVSPQEKIQNQNITLDSNSPTRVGYTFKGWGTSSTATTATYQPGGAYTGNGDLQLYAVWEAKTYTVTYNANGGTGAPANQTKTHDQSLTLASNSPTRTGYIFKGWGTNSTATTATYQPGEAYVGNGDLQLYAVWEVKTYTVTYNANGGNGAPANQTKTHDQTLKLSSNSPTRTGYTFKGWGTSSTATTATYQSGATYTSNADLNLYAVWEAKTYTVTYNANGGSGAPANQTKTHGQNLTLDSNSPTREGYTFQGWGTMSNSTVATCQPGAVYTADADLNLYAVWQIKTYTVTYNANGGSLDQVPATQTKTHGVAITISENSPVRDGYIFKGWGTSDTAVEIAYKPGDTYSTNANITLFAMWEEDVIYELSGKWQFNEELTKPNSSYLRQYIKFDFREQQNYSIIVDTEYGDPINLYFDDLGDPNVLYEYEDYYSDLYWNNVDNRIVNFGDTKQEVSQEFYEWFTVNATEIQVPTVNVDGLGDIEVSDPDTELTYDPDSGELGGVVPPVEDEPETPEEIPEEVLPEIIEFNYGNFEPVTNYTPGTYASVPYETTYTRTKYPVGYQNIVWSEWTITKDADGNVTSTVPGDMELADIGEQYSTYIVYDFETEETLESNGVKGDSVELWTIYSTTNDSIENAVYLAAYLNKIDGKTSRHIAKWDGTKYVAYDADADIAAVNTFVETYTVTTTKQVEVTAPSASTEYVYVPIGTLRAEKGMTWTQWLASDYNTTGKTNPTIKTSNFVDVAYSNTIVAGEDYGFVVYELSGVWLFNNTLTIPTEAIEQTVSFSNNGKVYSKMKLNPLSDELSLLYLMSDNTGTTAHYEKSWSGESFKQIDFGTESQSVTKEFYEWFVGNATEVPMSRMTFYLYSDWYGLTGMGLPGDEFYFNYYEGDTWNDVINRSTTNSVTNNGDSTIGMFYNSESYVTYNSVGTSHVLEPIVSGEYITADEEIRTDCRYEIYRDTGHIYYIVRI